MIGTRNQTTRDIEDIKAAQTEGVEAFGGDGWRKVKFAAESKAPFHEDLGDVGKTGMDDDEDDYEGRQRKVQRE